MLWGEAGEKEVIFRKAPRSSGPCGKLNGFSLRGFLITLCLQPPFLLHKASPYAPMSVISGAFPGKSECTLQRASCSMPALPLCPLSGIFLATVGGREGGGIGLNKHRRRVSLVLGWLCSCPFLVGGPILVILGEAWNASSFLPETALLEDEYFCCVWGEE